jgi:hypothetical protein
MVQMVEKPYSYSGSQAKMNFFFLIVRLQFYIFLRRFWQRLVLVEIIVARNVVRLLIFRQSDHFVLRIYSQEHRFLTVEPLLRQLK